MVGEPQQIPQSVIYELVNETINKSAYSIACPKTAKEIVWYVLMMPLTHIQYITIPDPLSTRNENYYPLTLVMSVIWVFLYAYVIVWFTYDITRALELKFSVIPMLIYPFGVSLRDGKKFQDFEEMIKIFKTELPDQEVSLAETYSP